MRRVACKKNIADYSVGVTHVNSQGKRKGKKQVRRKEDGSGSGLYRESEQALSQVRSSKK